VFSASLSGFGSICFPECSFQPLLSGFCSEFFAQTLIGGVYGATCTGNLLSDRLQGSH